MTNGNKKQTAVFFCLLLLPVLYVGYSIGKLGGCTVTMENASTLIASALMHPLPIQITDLTGKSIGIAIIIWAIAFLHGVSGRKNFMPGREYGTARFASPKEINKKLKDKRGNNKILSEHVRLGMDSKKTGLNNNAFIIGGSGTGKSMRLLRPNAYICEGSYVFTDPKGELLQSLGNYLTIHGYCVKVLNLVDMDRSDGYNPFDYIRNEEDISRMINNVVTNLTPKDTAKGEAFWHEATIMFLTSVASYEWHEAPKQGRVASFRGILELTNKAKIPEKDGEQSELDEIMFSLPADHPALITYKKVMTGAADTKRSIIISVNALLSVMQNPKVLRILEKDEMDICAFGEGIYENRERKTALFCVIPDNDKTYNFIVGMLYSQLFSELYFIADHKYEGSLPIPVTLWMDEFANISLPDAFIEILSTMRSRNISCNILIQNMAQIRALFKETWETIPGNCDALIYLGSNDSGTHKYISEMLGKYTIDKRSSGETFGSHGSSSENIDVLGRELMTPDEVRKMDNNDCLLFIRGFDPVIDQKYLTWAKREFKETLQLGKYVHQKELDEMYLQGRQRFYIDMEGERKQERSYRYQLEHYGCIFEQSKVFAKLQSTKEGYLRVGEDLGGYILSGADGEVEIFPAFTAHVTEYVKNSGEYLKKHPVCGYYIEDMYVAFKEETKEKLFRQEKRTTPLKRQFMRKEKA